MQRRSLAAVGLLVALAVAAGCLHDGDASEEYPPGVTADGVTDVDALVGAHEAALAGASYRVNATLTGSGPRLPDRLIMQMRFGSDGDYYGRRLLEGGGRARVEEVWRAAGSDRWYNATVTSTPDGLSRDVTVNDAATFPGTGFTFVNFTRKELREMTAGTDGAAGTVSRRDGAWTVALERERAGRSLRLRVTGAGLICRVVSEGRSRTWTVTTELIDGVEEPAWVREYRRSHGG